MRGPDGKARAIADTAHLVLRVAADGRSVPVRDADGELLAFTERGNAESFARGLVDAGVSDALLANPADLGDARAAEAVVFEDRVAGDQPGEARRLALELAPSLLRQA